MHAKVSSILRHVVAGALLLSAAIRGISADVVIDWNVAMTSFSEAQPPGTAPFIEARIYAMAHLAMLDAITEAGGQCNHGWKHHGPASAEAAAAQAAHNVLVNQFPSGAASFDVLLATQLAAIPDGTLKTRGIAIGADAAAEILAKRANDGAAMETGPYTPGTNPGDYQPTPPFDGPPFNGFVDGVNWGKVTPFLMKSGSQFRAPAPYKLTDLDYTFDLNEIKALGSLGSLDRTPDQTAVAFFWYENGSFGWNRMARILIAQHGGDLLNHARLLALLNAAMTDASIASCDSKFFYNFWRPITAIQKADTDGNDLTVADPSWQPLFLTPPVPDYPSNHAAMGGAASTVLVSFFGDANTFTFPSTSGAPRTYHKISDAAKENCLSRMLVGIHFRLACEIGYEQGIDVGSWAVKHAARLDDR